MTFSSVKTFFFSLIKNKNFFVNGKKIVFRRNKKKFNSKIFHIDLVSLYMLAYYDLRELSTFDDINERDKKKIKEKYLERKFACFYSHLHLFFFFMYHKNNSDYYYYYYWQYNLCRFSVYSRSC